MRFAEFFGGRKALSTLRYDWCPNDRKNEKKSEKMGAKFVRTTSTIYKQVERKLLPQHFTPCIVDVHPYKNFRLLITGCHEETVNL